MSRLILPTVGDAPGHAPPRRRSVEHARRRHCSSAGEDRRAAKFPHGFVALVMVLWSLTANQAPVARANASSRDVKPATRPRHGKLKHRGFLGVGNGHSSLGGWRFGLGIGRAFAHSSQPGPIADPSPLSADWPPRVIALRTIPLCRRRRLSHGMPPQPGRSIGGGVQGSGKRRSIRRDLPVEVESRRGSGISVSATTPCVVAKHPAAMPRRVVAIGALAAVISPCRVGAGSKKSNGVPAASGSRRAGVVAFHPSGRRWAATVA